MWVDLRARPGQEAPTSGRGWRWVRRRMPRRSRGLGDTKGGPPGGVGRPGGLCLPGSREGFLLKKSEEEPEVFDQNYSAAASFEDVGEPAIDRDGAVQPPGGPLPPPRRRPFCRGPKGHVLVLSLLFGMAFLSSSVSILTVKERRLQQVRFIGGLWCFCATRKRHLYSRKASQLLP